MKLWSKILISILVIVCYFISMSCIAVYFFAEPNSNARVNPVGFALLLLLGCITACFGSVLCSRIIGRKRAGKIMQFVLWIFFALYLLFIVMLTEFDRIYNYNVNSIFRMGSYARKLYMRHSVNLIPFKTIIQYLSALITHALPVMEIIINLLGNICAFMPFAFFLPLLFKRINSRKNFIVCMVCIVMTIEILQLIFMTGSCDIDDLILNVSGAWLMFEILKINKIQKLIQKFTLHT